MRAHHFGMGKRITAPGRADFERRFVRRVLQLREDSGLTQQQMADRLGVSRDTYSKYEARSLLPHYLVADFARICGVSVDFVMTGRPGGAAHAENPSPNFSLKNTG